MPEFNSSRFGVVEYNEETTLTFPKGLLQIEGFDHCKTFHLFHEEEGSRVLHYLQSLDDADLSFTLLDPTYLNVDYEIQLTEEEGELLGDFGEEEPMIMLMVYRPLRVQDEQVIQEEEIKAQTQSPLIINPSSRVGIQKIGLHGRLVFTNVDVDEE